MSYHPYPSGSSGGDLGGTYPNPTVTRARGLRETSGPTTLPIGAVADGEFLKRVGTDIVGVAGGGGGAPTDAEYLVALANGGLSAERVTTNTATVEWDHSVGGQAKANVPDGAISNAKIRDGGACSVVGRAANSGGDVADISAAANDQVLRRTGDAVGFGAVTEAMQSLSDNTTRDLSTAAHGYAPKAPNDTTKFLRGDATWATVPGRLRSVSVYATGTGATHTPAAGTTAMRIIAVGAGGGGGGADGSASNAGCGGGGGSGGVVRKWIFTAPTLTYTVPTAGGNGGTAGNNPGTAGADTTVSGTGISLTAKGGNGGASMAAGTTFAAAAGGTSAAGTTGGDLNVAGGVGDPGVRNSGTISQGGRGADGPFGNGGAPGIVAAAGANATGHGAGGGGAGTQGNNDRAGGNGAPGLLIVEEYF